MSLMRKLLLFSSGGALPFSPEQISGLVSWYDASDASTLWEDSARTIQAADNADVIGAWGDKSGNDYHITQATTGNKPTLRTNVQNGKAVVRSDGVDDFLRNTSFPDFGDGYTIYAVSSFDIGGGDIQTIFEVSTAAANTGFQLSYIFGAYFRARDASANRDISGSDIRDGVFRIHRAINTGTGLQYWINNSSIGTVAYTAPNPNSLNRLTVGANSGAGGAQNGSNAEILIYSGSHNATQQGLLNSYLNAKWGVY